MPRSLVAPVLLAMLLGCAPDAAREGGALRLAVDNHRAAMRALGQPAPAPQPVSRPAPTPRPAVRPASRPAAAASQFMGATPEALEEALGEPSFRRSEGTASVWLYAAGGCQLDLILYPDRGGALRVAHVQARAGGIQQRTEAACLRDIQARRDAPSDETAPVAPPFELGA